MFHADVVHFVPSAGSVSGIMDFHKLISAAYF